MRLYSWLQWLIPSLFLLMTGCTYTGKDNNLSGNAAGPVLGGAIGVAATAALGAPRPLVIGAGIGGAALGYYMTTLRFDAGPIFKSGGEVYSQGEYVGISIPSYKLFEPNSAEFTPQAEPLLDSAIAVLKRYPDTNIIISGNTSGMGNSHYDQKLSEARARQVASYLWSHGVNNFKQQSINNNRKLTFVGYGDYFPIVDSTKVGNIQKNSRIQITGYPSTADLKLDSKSTVFNNVGSAEDP